MPGGMNATKAISDLEHILHSTHTLLPNHKTFIKWAFEKYCNIILFTHWGRVTHIGVSKIAIICSDNGLSPGRSRAPFSFLIMDDEERSVHVQLTSGVYDKYVHVIFVFCNGLHQWSYSSLALSRRHVIHSLKNTLRFFIVGSQWSYANGRE